MTQQNEFAVGKAVCNEIGGAVLEVLGRKREFSVEALINVMREAQKDGHSYGDECEKAIEQAIRILQKFA